MVPEVTAPTVGRPGGDPLGWAVERDRCRERLADRRPRGYARPRPVK